MLWEAHDPRDALKDRFGFDDEESAGRWVAVMLAEHWGVRVDSCRRIVISDGNALAWVGTPSGGLIAKWSVRPARFPQLAETAKLTSWLGGRGLPVSAPVPARDGRLQVETGGVSMGLQREVVGELLDTTDPDQVRAAGVVLARLQEVAAILDFEEAQQEHRLVEVARAAVLLGTRYHDWGPVPAEVRAEFLAGYRSERPLTAAEADWLHILVLWQALAMVPAGDDPAGWGRSALSGPLHPR